jgi:hypothetical protein
MLDQVARLVARQRCSLRRDQADIQMRLLNAFLKHLCDRHRI